MDLTRRAGRSSSTRNGSVDIHMERNDEISALMREIAEYRVRRQIYRHTRDVGSDDMLGHYVYENKKKMLAEQGKVLMDLKKSISKRAFVLRRMQRVLIPSYREFFCIPQCAVHNRIP